MPGVGGGGGGGVGLLAITWLEDTHCQEPQRKDLDDQARGGDVEGAANRTQESVVALVESLQVVGQTPVDLRDIVTELLEALVDRGLGQREDEVLSREQYEHAGPERQCQRAQREDDEQDRMDVVGRAASEQGRGE
jgi:hypothetical protein